jgi:hypothetical protein
LYSQLEWAFLGWNCRLFLGGNCRLSGFGNPGFSEGEAVSMDIATCPAVWLRDNCAAGAPAAAGRGGGVLRRLRRWAQRLARPERARTLRLSPGGCLIFDNTRVLHGRTGFTSTGDRLLQGCYADLDGLASTRAGLAQPAEMEMEKEEVRAGASGGRDR